MNSPTKYFIIRTRLHGKSATLRPDAIPKLETASSTGQVSGGPEQAAPTPHKEPMEHSSPGEETVTRLSAGEQQPSMITDENMEAFHQNQPAFLESGHTDSQTARGSKTHK